MGFINQQTSLRAPSSSGLYYIYIVIDNGHLTNIIIIGIFCGLTMKHGGNTGIEPF